MSSPPRRPATASPSPHNKSSNASITSAPPDANDGYDSGGPHPPQYHSIRHHPGMGPPPHHEYLMPGEYPYPPPHHHMMGMPPDHYLMPPMMPPMHPSDMEHHHHQQQQHLRHPHNMMAEFPQPPPPARFMPPRPRVMRQPPRVPNRIIVESSNFDSDHHMNRRNHIGMDHHDLDHDMPKRKERAPSSSSFPTKLYKILADPQYREHVAWLPHGRAWRVLKPKAFEEDVIPKFFRSERYASFMRQVNGWGFKRITEGPDLNSYYHEMFLRGLPQVCAKMRRPQKGQGASQNKDALGQAPDFYKISLFAPLPPLEEEEATSDQQQQQHNNSPKTPDRTVSKSMEPEVTNSSSSATNESTSPLTKERAKIADTDSKEDSDDEEEDEDEEEEDKNANDELKPKVTPTRSESKAPLTPKTLFTNSPSYIPGASSPNQPDQYTGSTLSPTDIGRDFVELPTSAGNSVRSWTNSPAEEDLMFTGGNISNAFSQHDQQHFQLHSHHPYYNNHPHHPHPAMMQHHLNQHRGGGGMHPLPNFPISDGGVGPPGRPMIPPRGGFDMPSVDPTDGLSEADLSYLTNQNRILLSQATRSSGGSKKPSKSS